MNFECYLYINFVSHVPIHQCQYYCKKYLKTVCSMQPIKEENGIPFVNVYISREYQLIWCLVIVILSKCSWRARVSFYFFLHILMNTNMQNKRMTFCDNNKYRTEYFCLCFFYVSNMFDWCWHPATAHIQFQFFFWLSKWTDWFFFKEFKFFGYIFMCFTFFATFLS